MEPDPQRPSAELLLWAYRNAVFPMADPRTGRIVWFRPNPRAIIPLESFHVPKNLARLVRQGRFELRSDTRFEAVMRACATPRDPEDESWIDERLVAAYLELHALGHAHCVEAWYEDKLVGGLYGVSIGGAFMGESMFHRPDLGGSNASKVALVHLVRWLRHRGYILLDTQFWNPHLEQFGCTEIPHREYLRRLQTALDRNVTWGEFRPLGEDEMIM